MTPLTHTRTSDSLSAASRETHPKCGASSRRQEDEEEKHSEGGESGKVKGHLTSDLCVVAEAKGGQRPQHPGIISNY